MTELSSAFVCVMGMGTVFIGLLLIVLICKLLSFVTVGLSKPSAQAETAPNSAAKSSVSLPMPTGAEKAAILAGVCACIAEELGTDANNIKVTSFKRV